MGCGFLLLGRESGETESGNAEDDLEYLCARDTPGRTRAEEGKEDRMSKVKSH